MMTIEIIFTPIAADLFTTAEDIQPIADIVARIIGQQKCYEVFFSSFLYTAANSGQKFKIIFKEMTTVEKKDSNFIMREMNALLETAGLRKTLYVSCLTRVAEAGDKIFRSELYRPASTYAATLVARYDIRDDLIPENMRCTLSLEMMDDPVYIAHWPARKYERKQLNYWLFQQDYPQDPSTRQPVLLADVISDHVLRAEIPGVLKTAIETTLKRRKEEAEIQKKAAALEAARIKKETTFKNYNLKEGCSLADLQQALRRAAANNKADDISFFLSQGCDVNTQDENPIGRKTALHWATKNGHESCVQALLAAGARFDISDATDNTAVDYARRSTPQVKALFGISERVGVDDNIAKPAP